MSDVMSTPSEAAVIDPAIVSTPNAVEVDNVDHEAIANQDKPKAEPKAEEPAKKPTTREALEAARKKMDAEDLAEKAKAKTEGKETLKLPEPGKKVAERDDTGKFKGTQPEVDPTKPAGEQVKAPVEQGKEPGKVASASHDEPPARFSPEAKALHKDVPETYRAETHRAINELTKGIEEHAKRYEPIKQYDELAKQNGTTIDKALERYVAFDKLLNEDWEAGLESILRDKGLPPLKALAGHLLGRKPEETQQRSDQNTQRLERMVEQLTSQVQALGGHVQSSVAKDVTSQVERFAADKPWFDALQSEIAAHITAGLSLEDAAEKAHNEAQEKAKALGFIPQPAAIEATPKVPAVAQTDEKGTKSISGAPGAGAEPALPKARSSGSVRAALERARREATAD